MITVNFYIGLKDKNTKDYKYPKDRMVNTIIDVLKGHYEGFTLQECTGYFTHHTQQDDFVVVEDSIKVTVFTTINQAHIKEVCEELKEALNQECIAVEVLHSCINFI